MFQQLSFIAVSTRFYISNKNILLAHFLHLIKITRFYLSYTFLLNPAKNLKVAFLYHTRSKIQKKL